MICHGCGQSLAVPEDYAHRKLRCPACGVYCELPPPKKKAKPAAAPREHAQINPATVEEDLFYEDASATPSALAPPPQPAPKAPLPSSAYDDEDDGKPYDVAGGRERPCPGCGKPLAEGAVACTACGLDLQTGKKSVRTFQPVEREWETGLPLGRRKAIFIACQSVIIPLGFLGAWHTEDLLSFTGSWLMGSALLAFLLGTFDRINLSRNRKGKVELSKTWRACFIARPTTIIPLHQYEGVVTGVADDTTFWDWMMVFCLAPMGGCPAVIWWYYVILQDTYFVALTKDHGFPELMLYRGRSKELMKEISAVVSDVAGLPFERG